jgi:MarR family transcriptional regulator, organic hydroperoxide resistance regulator
MQGSRAELARSGLTAPQLSVVSLLGNRGPMTLSELSRELELSHSTVSGIVDRLHGKGVVERTPLPEDRRFVRISIADRIGHPGLRRADDSVTRLQAALASATTEERQRIRDGLALFGRFVESAQADPGDRP